MKPLLFLRQSLRPRTASIRMPRKYSYRSFVLLAGMLLLMTNPSFGQAQVENAMASIRTWIIVILNVAFLIGIAIGIFKAAMKFFTGAPDKIECNCLG